MMSCLKSERLNDSIAFLRQISESPEARITRLYTLNRSAADLLERARGEKMKILGYDSLAAAFLNAKTKCELAMREYDKFMR